MGLLHCIMSIVDIRVQIHDDVRIYRINRSAGVMELGVLRILWYMNDSCDMHY